jgi:molybdopterin converting factor small subunit
VARLLAGVAAVEVALGEGDDLGAALAALAMRCPSLVGGVIRAQRPALAEGYVLNLNGREFVRDLGRRPAAGDRVLVLAASAGG